MKLIKAELLKIKRMSIWALAVTLPIIAIILGVKTYAYIKIKFPEITPWQGLSETSSTVFVGMLLEMFMIYVTMVMGKVESSNNGWKQLLAMPVKRSKVYISKYIVVLLVLAVSLISYLIEYSIAAYFLGAKGMIPVEVFLNILYVFITIQPITIILFLLANKFSSVVIPIGVGMSIILSGFFIGQSNYWKYAPWTYPMDIIQGGLNIRTEILPLLLLSLLIFVLIFYLDIINFNRKDIV